MIREKLVNFVAGKILHAVTQQDVFTQNSKTGEIFLGGKTLSTSEVISLGQEVIALKNMRIWSILTSSIGEQAKKTMFENSQSWEDMVYGKSVLYAISLQESILKVLEQQKKIVEQVKK